jgi:hypothetical protein
MVNVVEYLNPIHQEILYPLSRWKILSLKELQAKSEFTGSKESFYKIIRRLEKALLIDSFIDSWSKEKHVYLEKLGLEFLGIEKKQYFNRDQRFHDALVVKIMRDLRQFNFSKETYLDFELRELLTSYDHIPDASLTGIKEGKEFKMAIELELNQKSKDRIIKGFNYYINSKLFNNVLFVFYKESTFKSYKKFLELNFTEEEQGKIILLVEPKLSLNFFNLANSTIYFKGQNMQLKDILIFEKSNAHPIPFHCLSNDHPVRDRSN